MSKTGLCRNVLDQFYTKPEIAKSCVDILRSIVPPDICWIEPSAGSGAFLEYVPNAIGYDIDPKHHRVQMANFLEVEIPAHCLVFGNPPFGRQSSMAKQFIRHASQKADWIGFILPRSFQKPSMQKAFPLCFNLVEQHDIDPYAFLVDGVQHNVPCIFQIWNRKTTDRKVEDILEPIGFQFVKKDEGYTFAFRRVGVYAGRCSAPNNQSEQSHYFIRLERPEKMDNIIRMSMSHTFPTNTTGPRSLSRNEATRFLIFAIANATG